MIKRLKPKSEFSRNVLTLMTGTALAQALPIAVAPILTRIYTPEDFGLLALFLAVFAVLSAVVTGRYEMAVMAQENEFQAENMVFLSILVALTMLVLTGLPVLFFSREIAVLLGDERIEFWLYFLPILLFASGVYQSIDYWLNRQKKYRNMAGNKLLKAGGISLVQLLVGYVNSAGLIIGSLVGWSLATLFVVKRSKLNFNVFNWKEIKRLGVRHRDYPLFQAPFSVLNSLSTQAPIFFIMKFFEASMVGFFSMVNKILSAPAALIAKSIGQVFFQRISEHARQSPELLMGDILHVALKLLVIALLVFSPVLFLGPEIFSVVFGEEWGVAGEFAQVLVFAVVVKFVVSPLSIVFLAIDKIRVGSLWQFIYFISTSVMLFIVYEYEYEYEMFLWIYVIHEVILYSLYFVFIIYSVRSFNAINKKI
ncbi:MAG: lipopolysaccharide biosynthesis protein [Gammaproteobacteria bacterium]|nr:lipopolysaccharide biosynthesis protein [Rhodospirillales bacterium]